MHSFEYHSGPDYGFHNICHDGMYGHVGEFWLKLETRVALFEWFWAILALVFVSCQQTPEIVRTVTKKGAMQQTSDAIRCASPKKLMKQMQNCSVKRRGA